MPSSTPVGTRNRMGLFSRSTDAWAVDSGNGARMVLCSFPCLELYLEVLDPHLECEVHRVRLTAGMHACVHCAGCGGLVAPVPRCFMHDDGCPPFSWRDAVALQRDFQAQWRSELGEDVPDLAWDLAGDVMGRDPTVTASMLVALVVGMLDS